MVDKNKFNPLDDLFTDDVSQIDHAALASILKPYIRINRESKNVNFTSDGLRITAANKIILYFLAKKVMFIKGEVESEVMTPRDVKEGLSLPSGTIDAALKRLSEKGPLRGQNGKYFIPDFNFEQVKELFLKPKAR